ncbi:AAA family ATPase [Caballeronia sp. LZ043]|uniref:AAA family ATPase n=1 Tax=Caballeronia sp. LZ043 TaxID=3038569 RepID=UPI0028555ADC|nr:AAA family ATPase [Caballeronia sp. LZ043]MDR5824232.1 AAA family ATPase [Caballeronia sp. LZ043]
MRLTSLELHNYRCYTSFTVSFELGFNVIAGVNGSGKTSLLKGIRDALAPSTHYVAASDGYFEPLNDRDSVRISVEAFGSRYRFEPQYPMKLVANGQIGGEALGWTVERHGEAVQTSIQDDSPGLVIRKRFDGGDSAGNTSSQDPLPILAYYPAYRHWPAAQARELAAVTRRESRVSGYSNWWDASADPDAVQEWVIAKTLERLQSVTDQGARWDAIVDDELAIANGALQAVVEDAKGLRYEMAQKSLIMEWLSGKTPTAFGNLSDGQRVAIALVTDIARRMCLLNPQLKQNVAQETPGVVLIDELDIHLHPKWQRLIVRGLTQAFPRVQFITASHSPQILSELHPSEIILLQPDGFERPQVSYGLDSSRILEQIMDAKPRPAEVEQALSELFAAIERNDLSNARNRLTSLKALAPGIPELAGAEALIKRKEVLGR